MERLVVWGDEAEELLADTEALVAVLRAWRWVVVFSKTPAMRNGPVAVVVDWALAEFGTLLPLSVGNRDERVARARRLRDLVQVVAARQSDLEALRGDVAGGSSGGETGSQGDGPRGSHDPVVDSAKEEDVVRCAVSHAPAHGGRWMILRLNAEQLRTMADVLDACTGLTAAGQQIPNSGDRIIVDGEPLAYLHWHEDGRRWLAEFTDAAPARYAPLAYHPTIV